MVLPSSVGRSRQQRILMCNLFAYDMASLPLLSSFGVWISHFIHVVLIAFLERCLWNSKRKLRGFNIAFTTFSMNFTKCLFNAGKKSPLYCHSFNPPQWAKIPATFDTFDIWYYWHVILLRYMWSRIVVRSKVNFIERISTRLFLSTGKCNDSRWGWIAFWQWFTRKQQCWFAISVDLSGNLV